MLVTKRVLIIIKTNDHIYYRFSISYSFLDNAILDIHILKSMVNARKYEISEPIYRMNIDNTLSRVL